MRLALVALLALALPASAQTHVAPTDALSPADERKSFQLPPGFEAQLVAAEPDIGKPIQIAFDAKGRLWATTSRHYPFPAEEGQTSDKLYVLSDFGPDGKAKTVTVFDDKLNIPIGVLPLPDCKSCLVSSVGSVLKLTDTDGDGKADKRETLLSGFGTEDTHGMTNSFVLLPDGWVYATHGFKNTSAVKGTDGSTITMNSGNTYRFRPDGSDVQHWTFGQVNPFGLCVDPYFNLYTADCHSKPITQLIRGAYYQSFGKPHDGLGFAPHVTRHDHKSTALCGLAWYDADHFPKEWTGCLFLGNVTGNRINADRIEWKGSTPVGKELPDFLVSSDPWFRPTDVKLGPDGALYVADFYNKIIGHYEVPLKHPGRDKDRGRIWRVVWKGEDGKAKPPEMPFKDLTADKPAELIKRLEDSNLSVRLTAANQLARYGKAGVEAFPEGNYPKREWVWEHPRVYSTYLMLAEQAGAADEDVHGNFSALPWLTWDNPVREELATGIARGLGTRHEWGPTARQIATAMLRTDRQLAASFRVRRAFVEAISAHPHQDFVKPLIALIQKCPAEDTHLRHAARVALRNALRDEKVWATLAKAPDADLAVIADVAPGLTTKEAVSFLAEHVAAGKAAPGRVGEFAEHVGRYDETGDRSKVVAWCSRGKPDQLPVTVAACRGLARGMQAAGVKPESMPSALVRIAVSALKQPDAAVSRSGFDLLQELIQIGMGTQAQANIDEWADAKALLAARAAKADAPADARVAAAELLAQVAPARGKPVLYGMLRDAAASIELREKAALALSSARQVADRAVLREAITGAPYRLSVAIAQALATDSVGAEFLLGAVKAGQASPRLLQEKAVLQRLRASKTKALPDRLAALTKGLPPAEQRIDDLIRTRAASFGKAKPDAELGKKAFTQHCANCHQVGGEGQKVGPQLDGIGARGAERLLEDILDPNRNVDAAFRATVLNLADGRTLTGLLVREEGQVLVLADAAGKEVRVPQADVEKRTINPLSPMPANFDTAIPEADFHHLLAYLMEQRATDPSKK